MLYNAANVKRLRKDMTGLFTSLFVERAALRAARSTKRLVNSPEDMSRKLVSFIDLRYTLSKTDGNVLLHWLKFASLLGQWREES